MKEMSVRLQRWLHGTLRRAALKAIGLLICGFSLWSFALHAQTQSQDITCDGGSGAYRTEFSTGVTVDVGPMRKGAFAERACSAKLVAKGQEIPVVDDAGQVAIDILGADLGFGKPVVAFQIDETGRGSHVVYQIYSLSKPAALLYKLSGGDRYSAADTDLDGRVEIWTDDAVAVDQFEGIPKADLDFAPTVVLRFEKGHLVDAGSEFVSYYDAEISKLRSQMNQADLAEFEQSDGRLSFKSPGSNANLHRLIRTKISVLEVIWAYLYSGREEQAWSALDELWPSQDVTRVRSAISDVHSRGILHGVERSSSHKGHAHGHVHIYDAVDNSPTVTNLNPYGGAPNPSQAEPPVTQPKSILLRRPTPPPDGGSVPSENEIMELVVDAAGKVRSAQVLKATDAPLVRAASGWHFIPAFHSGSPVACRFRLNVWTLR